MLDVNAMRVEKPNNIPATMPPMEDTATPEAQSPAGATWRDYVTLTKPRIISLLLFTTLAALWIAADSRHPVGFWLFWAVAFGGYMAAGAANTLNMVIDSDIDGRMARTAQRPTVTHNISTRNALLFAVTLMIGSFGLLWSSGGLLCALLAQAGLAFYVVIYTLLLKRRTWHNIVIGGAAGAFPPLVGYTAITHQMTPLAWYLFAIIFFWTPVHFWALALLIQDDYRAANIPMLPVVKGDHATVVQIAAYTLLTVIITALPFFQHYVSWVYFGASVLLNALLIMYSLKLYRNTERQEAKVLFHYSMLYLALLFLFAAIDRAIYHV